MPLGRLQLRLLWLGVLVLLRRFDADRIALRGVVLSDATKAALGSELRQMARKT
jgi:hypothetical protein